MSHYNKKFFRTISKYKMHLKIIIIKIIIMHTKIRRNIIFKNKVKYNVIYLRITEDKKSY